MALPAPAQSMPNLPARDPPSFQPAPSRSDLLQRDIENTLLALSALPETQEQKILLDLGLSSPLLSSDISTPDARAGTGDEPRHIAIQCNQLPLFERLEELVAQLTPEERAKLLGGLHPAMSVREREALKIVLENGVKGLGVVPKPLRVRKASTARSDTETAAMEGKAEREVEAAQLILEPLKVRMQDGLSFPDLTPLEVRMQDGLSFPELTKDEFEVRRRELAIALAERDTGLAEMFSEVEDAVALKPSKSMQVLSTTAAAEARQKKQEIANMFAMAAKRLQALDSSLVLNGTVHSPAFKEGLHLVKAATSALRAYTDATPREVVVRMSQDPGRPSREVVRPAGMPEVEEGAEDDEVEPPWMNELFLKRLSGQRVPAPAPVVSQGRQRGGDRAPPIIQQQLPRSVTISTMASLPPPLPPQPPAPNPAGPVLQPPSTVHQARPHSDPPTASHAMGKRQGTCPWPESFFTSPRAAPVPRASSLPVPPRPRRPGEAASRVGSLTLPHPPPPPTPPPKSPPPQSSVIRRAPPAAEAFPTAETTGTVQSSTSSDIKQRSETSNDTVIETTAAKRKGSIAAARAGIAERAKREGRGSAVLGEVRGKGPHSTLGMSQRGKGK